MDVEAAVVVVAVQIGDLAEVAEGGNGGRLELIERQGVGAAKASARMEGERRGMRIA